MRPQAIEPTIRFVLTYRADIGIQRAFDQVKTDEFYAPKIQDLEDRRKKLKEIRIDKAVLEDLVAMLKEYPDVVRTHHKGDFRWVGASKLDGTHVDFSGHAPEL